MGTLNVSNINGGQLGGFRNLIINGNFQVNQRNHDSITEETSGTAATGYHYDRWYYNNTDSYLYQGVEDKSVANGTYTLSWVDAGSDITAAYVISTDTTAGDGPDSGLTWTTVSNGGNITVNEGTEYSKHLWVRFGGTLSNLSKVQLEHGTQATPFEHRTYGDELARCKRYYADGQYRGTAVTYGTIVSPPTIYHPVEMRSSPSLSFGTVATSSSDGISGLSSSVTGTHYSNSKSFAIYVSSSSEGYGYISYTWTAQAEL